MQQKLRAFNSLYGILKLFCGIGFVALYADPMKDLQEIAGLSFQELNTPNITQKLIQSSKNVISQFSRDSGRKVIARVAYESEKIIKDLNTIKNQIRQKQSDSCVQIFDLKTEELKNSSKVPALYSLKTDCVPATQSISVLPNDCYKQNPNAPAIAFFPNPDVKNSLLPSYTIGKTFLAETPSLNCIQIGVPPDAMGVVGPTQFIVATNHGIISYDKQLGKKDRVLHHSPNSFISLNGGDVFEPRIQYDHFSQRWFILYNVDAYNLADNGFYLAMSHDKIITSSTRWTVLYIPNNTYIPNQNACGGDKGAFLDYPTLGIDTHAIYISANMFFKVAGIQSNTVFIIPKKYLFSDDDEPIIVAQRDISGFYKYSLSHVAKAGMASVQTVTNFDENAQYGYLIQTSPFLFGKLNLWRIINPDTSTPQLVGPFSITVPTTAVDNTSVGVPTLGNVYGKIGLLHPTDDRLVTAHIRNGQLYAAHFTLVNQQGIALFDETQQHACGDRGAIRWYQIDLTGDCSANASYDELPTTEPILVQAGTLFDPSITDSPLWYFVPSLMTNKHGDMIIAGSLSGKNSYAQAFCVGRKKSDPLGILRCGVMGNETIFAESSGIFTRSLNAWSFRSDDKINGFQRWGNYTMTSLDPEDQTTFWTIQEVHKGNIEELWVARLNVYE